MLASSRLARASGLRGCITPMAPANTVALAPKISVTTLRSPGTRSTADTRNISSLPKISSTRSHELLRRTSGSIALRRNHRFSLPSSFGNKKRSGKLGFYGFGAAAHLAIQVALHWNVDVYAMTRDDRHRRLALDLGATWAGDTFAEPPEQLDAAIVFAPAGEIVPAALKVLRKGGALVLGGIHMSPIPSFSYDLLYQERVIRSVANNTRQDGEDFLRIAAEIPIRTRVQLFPLQEANRALNALKNDAIRGSCSSENGGP